MRAFARNRTKRYQGEIAVNVASACGDAYELHRVRAKEGSQLIHEPPDTQNSLGDVEHAAGLGGVARGSHARLEFHLASGDPHRPADGTVTVQLGLW